jgi:hypothetical protein
MNILVFSRRRHFGLRNEFVNKIYPKDVIINCSDERKVSAGTFNTIWWLDFKINIVDQKIYQPDIEDIILRCRFLRELDRSHAIDLIQEAFNTWDNILSSNQINVVYSLPIDSYILHTLQLVCESKKISFFSTVGTFMDNRIRITNYGELAFNKVDYDYKKEVDDFIKCAEASSLRPSWLIGVGNTPIKTSFKRLVIDSLKPLFFFLYRKVRSDRDSFSFAKNSIYKKRMFATTKRFLVANSIEKNALNSYSNLGEYNFIPLQFYPEVTSDYWNRDLNLINHHKVVLEIVRALPDEKFVIKEHPASFGRRDEKFLNELSKCDNVVFAKLLSDVNSWINNSKVVLGNASTTTINAIILQKPVLFFSKPYFGSSKNNYLYELSNECIRHTFHDIPKNQYSELEILELLSKLFRSSAQGSLGNYKPFGESNKSTLVNVTDDFKQYLRDYLEIQYE